MNVLARIAFVAAFLCLSRVHAEESEVPPVWVNDAKGATASAFKLRASAGELDDGPSECPVRKNGRCLDELPRRSLSLKQTV